MSLKSEVQSIVSQLENPDGNAIFVEFYDRAVYDKEASEEAGHPVYKNTLFVKKHKDSLSVYDNRAEQVDIHGYPSAYKRYVNDTERRKGGVPVGMLPGIDPATREMLEDAGVYTVELLCELDDSIAKNYNVDGWKRTALEYMSRCDRLKELEAENEALKKQLESKNDTTNNGGGDSGRDGTVRKTVKRRGKLNTGDQAGA